MSGPVVSGYACLFNTPVTIAGLFEETVRPGAFAASLARRDDVRALFNHDRNYPLARVANGTLRLSEDARGLKWEADLADTTVARDLAANIEAGVITQCSYAFLARREEWDERPDLPLRTVVEADLFDVSAVTVPATDSTTISVKRAARRLLKVSPAAADVDQVLADLEARGLPVPFINRVRARVAAYILEEV